MSLATGLTLGSTALGVAGSLLGGAADKKAAQYQSMVAVNNAQIMKQNAQQSLLAGQREESEARAAGTELRASQRTGYAGNNIDVGVGTPVEVDFSTRNAVEKDALVLRYNAAREAYGYRLKEQELLEQSKQYKKQAKSAMLGGVLGAAKSIIGGASSLHGQAAAMKAAGG